MDEIVAAAQQANIHDFISNLPLVIITASYSILLFKIQ